MRRWVLWLALALLAWVAEFPSRGWATVLIDDLDDPSAWSGTAERQPLGPLEAKEGNGALRMRIWEGAEDAYPSLSRELPKLDLSKEDVLTFWVKPAAEFEFLQVRLSDSQGRMAESGVLALQKKIEPGRWYWVVWPYRVWPGWVHPPGEMVWSQITGLTFYGTRPAEPTDIIFSIDEVKAMTFEEAREAIASDPDKAEGNRWLLWSTLEHQAQEVMPEYFKGQGEGLARTYEIPSTREEFEPWRKHVVDNLWKSFRLDPGAKVALEAKVLRSVEREGYRVEVVTFKTWPNVWVPANLYLPTKGEPPFPAILLLPGHGDRLFSGAYQQMAQRFALEGFVLMFVEPFGAGERSVNAPFNDYHGGFPAGALWPLGMSLNGLVVFDNCRALDYLLARPEVDKERIGVTGISGGGSHTMWLAAADERVKAAVAIASGFGAAKDGYYAHGCICDTILEHLRYGEENWILGACAPRPFLWVHLSSDAPDTQEELEHRAQVAKRIYQVAGAPEGFQVRLAEGPHGYFPHLQEMALEWFSRWLRGKEPSPLKEGWQPNQEPKEVLGCWLVEGRPKEMVTLSGFAQERAKELVGKVPGPPTSVDAWAEMATELRARLRCLLALSDDPRGARVECVGSSEYGDTLATRMLVETEPGLRLSLVTLKAKEGPSPTRAVLLLHPEGKKALAEMPLVESLVGKGYLVATLELRHTGETRWNGESGGYLNVRDYDFCRAAVKLGRPAMGMWVWDILKGLRAIADTEKIPPPNVTVIGWQEAGLAGVFAGALDEEIAGVVGTSLLGSYYGPSGYGSPFVYQGDNRNLGGLGSLVPMVPDVLSVGDIPQFASLLAPRPLLLCQPCWASGEPMNQAEAQQNFAWTQSTFSLLGAADNFALSAEATDEEILNWLEDSAKGR